MEKDLTTMTWRIETIEELKAFRDEVNAGNTFAGWTITLEMVTIDLSKENWIPIGTLDNPFEGTFTGIEHTNPITLEVHNTTITGLTIDGNKEYTGLFGVLQGDGKVQNLNFKDVAITNGGSYVGTVAGYINGEYGSCAVENITVSGVVTIEGEKAVGGIIGGGNGALSNVVIAVDKEGTSESYVKATSGDVGGIAGRLEDDKNPATDDQYNGLVSNIDVKGEGLGIHSVGGIAGSAGNNVTISNSSCTADSVIAEGIVLGRKENVGGIVGNHGENVTLENAHSDIGTIGGTYTDTLGNQIDNTEVYDNVYSGDKDTVITITTTDDIVVDGEEPVVKEINVDMTAHDLVVAEGHTLKFDNANVIFTGDLTVNGTIEMTAAEDSIKGADMILGADAKIIIDAKGITEGFTNVIDLDMAEPSYFAEAAAAGKIEFVNLEPGMTVFYAKDGDIAISDADYTRVYLTDDAAGQKFGAELMPNVYAGINGVADAEDAIRFAELSDCSSFYIKGTFVGTEWFAGEVAYDIDFMAQEANGSGHLIVNSEVANTFSGDVTFGKGITIELNNGTVEFSGDSEVVIDGSFSCKQIDLADVKVTIADTAFFSTTDVLNVNNSNVVLAGGTVTSKVAIADKAVLDIAGDAVITDDITGNGTICIYNEAGFIAQGDVAAYRIYVGYDYDTKEASAGSSFTIEGNAVLADTFNVQNGNAVQVNGTVAAAQYYLKSADVTVAAAAKMTVGEKGVTLLGNGSALTVYGEMAWDESAKLTVSKNTALTFDGGQMTTAADVTVTVETAGTVALLNGSTAAADTFVNNGTFNVTASGFDFENLSNDGIMNVKGAVALDAANLIGSGTVNFIGATLGAGTVFSSDSADMTYIFDGNNLFEESLSFATAADGSSFRIGEAADKAATLTVADGKILTVSNSLTVGCDGEFDQLHKLVLGNNGVGTKATLEMGGTLTVGQTGYLKADDADLNANNIAVAGVVDFTNADVTASALTINGSAEDKAKAGFYGGSELNIDTVTVDQAVLNFGRAALNGDLDVTAAGTANFTAAAAVNGTLTNAGAAAVFAAAVLTAADVANNGDMNVDGTLNAATVTTTAALALTADAALTAEAFANSGTVDLNGADFTAATLTNTAEMNVTGEVMFNVAAVEGNGTVNFTDVTLAAGNVYEDTASDMVYNFAGTNTVKADVNFGKTVNQTGLLDITSKAVFEADTINAAGYLSVVVGTVNADTLNVVGDEARVRINGTGVINAADIQIGSDTEKGKLDFANGTINGAVTVNALGAADISGDSVVVGSVANAGTVTIDNKLTVADFANTGVLAVTDGGAFEIETLTNNGTMTAAGTVTLKAELTGNGAVNFTDAVLSADSVLTDTDADAAMAFTFAGTNEIQCALELAQAAFQVGAGEEEARLTIADDTKVAVAAVTVGADGTGRLHQLFLGAKTALEADTLTVALTGYLNADISSITADDIAVAGDARFVNTAVTADALTVSGTADDKAFLAISGGSKPDIAAVTVDQGTFEFSRATVTGAIAVTADGTVNVTSDKSVAEGTITNAGSFNILTGKGLTAADIANDGAMNVDGTLNAATVTNTAALALTADAALTAEAFANSGTVDLNGADFTVATLTNTAEMNVTGEVMFNVAAVEGNGTVNFTDVTLAAGNVYEDAASDMVYNFAGANTVKADVNFGKTVNQTGLLDITSKGVFEADTINAAGYLSVVVGTVNADTLNVVGDEARIRINGTGVINAADIQIGSDTEKGKLDFVNGTINGAVTVNALGAADISGDSVVNGSVANAGIVAITNKLTVADFANTGVLAVTDGGAFVIENLTNDGTMNVTGAVTLNAANVAGSGTVNFTGVTLAAGNVYEDTASDITYNFDGANTVKADLNFGTKAFVAETGSVFVTAGGVFEADAITVAGILNAVTATVDADKLIVAGETAKLRIHGGAAVNAADIQIGSDTEAGLFEFMNGTVTGAVTVNALGTAAVNGDSVINGSVANAGIVAVNNKLTVADFANTGVFAVNGGAFDIENLVNDGTMNITGNVALDAATLTGSGTVNFTNVTLGAGTVFSSKDAAMTYIFDGAANVISTSLEFATAESTATMGGASFQIGASADSAATLILTDAAVLTLGKAVSVGGEGTFTDDGSTQAHKIVVAGSSRIEMAEDSRFTVGQSGALLVANNSDVVADNVDVAGYIEMSGALASKVVTIAGEGDDIAEITIWEGGKAQVDDKIQVGAADGKGKGVLYVEDASVKGLVQISASGQTFVKDAASITEIVNDGSVMANGVLTADKISNNKIFFTTGKLEVADAIVNTDDFKADNAAVTAASIANNGKGKLSFINGTTVDVTDFANEAVVYVEGGAFAADTFVNNGTMDVTGEVMFTVAAVDAASNGTINFTDVTLAAGNVFEDAASAMTYTFAGANAVNADVAFGGTVQIGTDKAAAATLALGAGADLTAGTLTLGVAGAEMAAESFKQLYQLTVEGAKLTASSVTVDQSGYMKFKGGTVDADTVTVAGYADVIGYSAVTADSFVLNGENANLRLYGSSTITADVQIAEGNMYLGLGTVAGDLTVAAKGAVEVDGNGTVTGKVANSGAIAVNAAKVLKADSMTNAGTLTAEGAVTVAGNIFNYPAGTITAGADAAITADSFTNRGTIELNGSDFTAATFLNSNVGTYKGVMNVTGEVMFNIASVDAASNGTVNFTDVTLAAANVFEDAGSNMVYNFAGANVVAADLNFGKTVNQTGKLDIVAGAVFEADTITADGFVNVVAGTLEADTLDVTGADAKVRIHGYGKVNADVQIGSDTEAGLLDFMNGTVTGTVTVGDLGVAAINGNSTVAGTLANTGIVTVAEGKALTADAVVNAGTLTVTAAAFDAAALTNNSTMDITGAVTFKAAEIDGTGSINFTDAVLSADSVIADADDNAVMSVTFAGENTVQSAIDLAQSTFQIGAADEAAALILTPGADVAAASVTVGAAGAAAAAGADQLHQLIIKSSVKEYGEGTVKAVLNVSGAIAVAETGFLAIDCADVTADTITVAGFADVIEGASVTAGTLTLDGKTLRFRGGSAVNADVTIANGLLSFGLATVTGALDVVNGKVEVIEAAAVNGDVTNAAAFDIWAGSSLTVSAAVTNNGAMNVAGALTAADFTNTADLVLTAGAALTADTFANEGTVELTGANFTAAALTNNAVMNVTGEMMFNVAAVAGNGTVNFTDVTLGAGNVFEDAASDMVYNFAGANTVAADVNFGKTAVVAGTLELAKYAIFEADSITVDGTVNVTAGTALEAETVTVDGFVNVVAGTVDADVIDVTGADAKLRIHGNGKVNADIQIGSDTEAGLLDFMNGTVTGTVTVGDLGVAAIKGDSTVAGTLVNTGIVTVAEGKALTADAIDNAGVLTVTAAGLDVDALNVDGELNISGVVALNLTAVSGSGKINFTNATLGAGTVFTTTSASLSYIFNGANTIASDLSFAPLASLYGLTRNTPVFQIGSSADEAASLTIDAAVAVANDLVIGVDNMESKDLHQLIITANGSVSVAEGKKIALEETAFLKVSGALTADTIAVDGTVHVNGGTVDADTITLSGADAKFRILTGGSVNADLQIEAGKLEFLKGSVNGDLTVGENGRVDVYSAFSTVNGTINNEGDIYITQQGCLTADALTGNGDIFYVVTDFESGVKQFIDIKVVPEDLSEKIFIVDTNGEVIEDLNVDFGPDGKIYVTDADVTKVLVDSNFAGDHAYGDKVGDKLYYGVNAFASMDEAAARAAEDKFVAEINGAAGQDVALYTGITTANPDGLVVNMGSNGLSFDKNGTYILLDGGTPVVGAEIWAKEDAVFGENVTINADVLWANDSGIANDIQGTINVNGVYVHLGTIDLTGALNVSDRMVITDTAADTVVTVREGAVLTAANINSFEGSAATIAVDGSAVVGNIDVTGTVAVGEKGALDLSEGGAIGTLAADGAVTLAPVTLQVGTLTGAGSITVDAASFTKGTVKVLDITGSAAEFEGSINFTDVASGMTILTLADGDKVLTDARFDTFYVNAAYDGMAYGEATEGKKTYYGINAFASFNDAYEANARALEEGAPKAADAIVLHSDITDDLGSTYSGKIGAGKEPVTLTNNGSAMYNTDLTVGSKVTLETAMSVWQGNNEIAGSIVSTNYVHNWGKTVLTGTAEVYNFFDRYHESEDSGFYVVGSAAAGEGAAAEAQLKGKGYLGHYSGTFSVKDSAVEFGYFNLIGTHDGDDYVAAKIVLDNAGFKTVGGPNTQPGQLLMEGDVSIEAVNGSVIDIRGPKEFGYLSMKEGTAITLTDSAMYLGREGQGGNTIGGTVTLNSSVLNSLGKLNISATGSLVLDGASTVTATQIIGDGEIILDVTGFTGETVKVIELSGTASLEGKVTVKGDASVFYGADGDVWVSDQDKSVIYVGGDYQDKALGEIVNGNVAGFNAFSDIYTAMANMDAATGTVQVEQGNTVELNSSFMEGAAITTENAEGLVIDLGNNDQSWHWEDIDMTTGEAPVEGQAYSQLSNSFRDFVIGENVTLKADFMAGIGYGSYQVKGAVEVNAAFLQGHDLVVGGTMTVKDWLTLSSNVGGEQLTVNGSLTAAKADISEGFAFDVNGTAALDYVEAAGTLATSAEGTLTLKNGSAAAIANKGSVIVTGDAEDAIAIGSVLNEGTFDVTGGTADIDTIINTGAVNVQGGTFAADTVQMEYGTWEFIDEFAKSDADRTIRVSFIRKGDTGKGVAISVTLAANETSISGVIYDGLFDDPELNAYLTAGEYTVTAVDTQFVYSVESSMTIAAGTFEVTGEAAVNAVVNNGFVLVTETGILTDSALTAAVAVEGGSIVNSTVNGAVSVAAGSLAGSVFNGTLTVESAAVNGTVEAAELVLNGTLDLIGTAAAATLTVSSDAVINAAYGSALQFSELVNTGSITFGLEGRDGVIFRVMDYIGTETMDLAAYGALSAEGFSFTVYNNDLYAVTGDFSEADLTVNTNWAGTEAFTDIEGLLYGVNAFGTLDELNGKSFDKLTIRDSSGDMGSFDFGDTAVDVKVQNTDAAAELTMRDGSLEIGAGSTLDGIVYVEHSMFVSGEGTFAGTLQAATDLFAMTGITLEIVGTTVNTISGFTAVTVENAALTDITMSIGSDIFYAESSLAVNSFDFCTGLDDLLYLADGVTIEAAEIASAGALTIFADADSYAAGSAIITVSSNGAFANAGTSISVELGKGATLQSQYVLVDGITEFNGYVVFGDQKVALGGALYVNSVEYDLHLTDGKLTLDIFHGKEDLHVHSDLNGDDVADILITDIYGSAGAWLVGEDGSLAWKQLYSIGQNSGWNFFDVIDTNADGRSDVVLYNNNGTIGVWEMQADGSAVYDTITKIGTEIPIIMRDFDGDGAADMLTSNQAGDTLAFRFADGKTYVGRINDWEVKAVTDLDGNGVADVILQNGTAVGAWLMGENGQPSWWGSAYALGAKNEVAGAGDFDGNGVGDILISTANADGSTSYGAWMFDNARNIVWRSFTTLKADSTLEGIDDYDGDGSFELRIRTGNEISILDLGVSLDDSTVTVDKKVLGSVTDNHITQVGGKVL